MATLHIYQPNKRYRIRMKCPYHKHYCYGQRADYYDGSYITFDCGTRIDGEGWTPPPKKKCPLCRKVFRDLDMPKHITDIHKTTMYQIK